MIYYCDGFCVLKNPSPQGGGYTVINSKKKMIKEEHIEKFGFTNNEAELRGIYEALKISKKNDVVCSDSQTCIGWVLRGKSGSRNDLNYIAGDCLRLIKTKKIFLAWLPREENLAGHYNERFEVTFASKTLF